MNEPQNTHRTLGIMAKYWEKGRVKTRLARSLVLPLNTLGTLRTWQNGQAASRAVLSGCTDPMGVATEIHEVFVRYLVGQLHQSADSLELVASPPSRLGDFQAVVAELGITNGQIIDQGTGDLGERMKRWFARHLQCLASPPSSAGAACVLIGADCPLLSPADLDVAWGELTIHDLVLGPAFDGGYYLIGLNRRSSSQVRALAPRWLANLFEDIPWGTDSVFERTLTAAESAGLSVAILGPRHDVDTADDLRTLLATLQDFGDREHPLLKALCAMKTQ